MKPGKMTNQVLRHLFKRPATIRYPGKEFDMPKRYRGRPEFYRERCAGCRLCMKDCPTDAITIDKIGEKFTAEIDLARCIYCGQCADSCPKKALEITSDVELAQFDITRLKITL